MNYMETGPSAPPGLWELAVLSLLREAPMHPYQMQRLLNERHKAELLALKKGSLYHAIHRLERDRFIERAGTGRNGRRPERTTYRITREGEREQNNWLRTLIADPKPEPSEFMASLSFLVYLEPAEAIAGLEQRARTLSRQIAESGCQMKSVLDRVTRIHLIETEYLRAMQRAELAWVRRFAQELRKGGLTWDIGAILKALRQHHAAAAKDSK